MNRISAFFNWFGESCAFVMAPLWNHADRMQKVSRFLFRCFVIMVVVGLLVWLSQRPVFELRQVVIEPVAGQTLKHINKPLVRQQVLETVHGNFFSVRLEDIKRGFESMPWVRHANVRRVWPNGLAVSIEEQKAFATWGGADSHKLMNSHGEVFSGRVSDVPDDTHLLDFSGPDDAGKEVMRLYEKANTWFKPWSAEVKSLTLSDRYAWHIKLSNGMRLEFGRDEESSDKTLTEERVTRLFKYWPQVQERWANRVDAIDLRYANGFAVHLASANIKKSEVDDKKSERKQ